MLITRDQHQGKFQIHSYEPGKLAINDAIYEESVILNADRLESWAPQSMPELTAEHCSTLLSWKPKMVILGTGTDLLFLDPRLLALFTAQKIGIEVMTTLAACRTFQLLMSEDRPVVAALLIR